MPAHHDRDPNIHQLQCCVVPGIRQNKCRISKVTSTQNKTLSNIILKVGIRPRHCATGPKNVKMCIAFLSLEEIESVDVVKQSKVGISVQEISFADRTSLKGKLDLRFKLLFSFL